MADNQFGISVERVKDDGQSRNNQRFNTEIQRLQRRFFVSTSDAPAITDDSSKGFEPGSFWFRVSTSKVYALFDATVGAAVWTILN